MPLEKFIKLSHLTAPASVNRSITNETAVTIPTKLTQAECNTQAALRGKRTSNSQHIHRRGFHMQTYQKMFKVVCM